MTQPTTNPLKNMKIDYWYKALVAVGAVLFILNGSNFFVRYPAIPIAFLSGGIFFIGLGEWRNHPLQIRVIGPGLIAKSHPRRFTFIGSVLDVFGIALMIVGAIKLF